VVVRWEGKVDGGEEGDVVSLVLSFERLPKMARGLTEESGKHEIRKREIVSKSSEIEDGERCSKSGKGRRKGGESS